MEQNAIDKYILERQTIFNSLSYAISKGINNYAQLKETTPRLEEICKAFYADKGIPEELETEKVFRYFRMIWKDDSLFRKPEVKDEPQATTDDTKSV